MENDGLIHNPEFTKKWEDFEQGEVIYTIGVDATFKDVCSYCLTRTIVDKSVEIILTKSIVDNREFKTEKSEFLEEVKNLAKYFNAKIIGDWDKIN